MPAESLRSFRCSLVFIAALSSWAGNAGAVWDDLVRHLTEGFLNQVQCVTHRDFHSRNIMCLKGDDLGLIDFKDAVVGPVTYDPVSLLKDCYVQWPRSNQLRWLGGYRGELLERHVAAPMLSILFATSI